MLTIQKVTDSHKNRRLCLNFGLDDPQAQAFVALQGEKVLGSGAFLTENGLVTVWGLDTGRTFQSALADGLLRAAFHSAYRQGAKTACLGERLSPEQRKTLGKLGYPHPQPLELAAFFRQKPCQKP